MKPFLFLIILFLSTPTLASEESQDVELISPSGILFNVRITDLSEPHLDPLYLEVYFKCGDIGPFKQLIRVTDQSYNSIEHIDIDSLDNLNISAYRSDSQDIFTESYNLKSLCHF